MPYCHTAMPNPEALLTSFSAEGDEPAAEVAEPKAAKKAKKVQPVEPEADDIASVGDPALARSGKKIIKALYKEHKEVTAMTQDKVGSGARGGDGDDTGQGGL